VKALDTQAIRKAEESAAARGVSRLLMMESAGKALAQAVANLYDLRLKPTVLVVAGTGNNGGDGAAAGRHLHERASVTVILLGDRSRVRTEEAALQWRVLSTMNDVRVIQAVSAEEVRLLEPYFRSSHVIIDAIFGTGVKGEVGEPHASAIEMINDASALRLAVDVPSGLDPDTGEDHGLVVKADVTVTLHAPKPGLLMRPDVVGKVFVEEIGLP
jgi:NAD(P)H-hydrate epimerase